MNDRREGWMYPKPKEALEDMKFWSDFVASITRIILLLAAMSFIGSYVDSSNITFKSHPFVYIGCLSSMAIIYTITVILSFMTSRYCVSLLSTFIDLLPMWTHPLMRRMREPLRGLLLLAGCFAFIAILLTGTYLGFGIKGFPVMFPQ
jgi:hypothetical protein